MLVTTDSYISTKLGNTKIEYVISFPKNYDKTKKYPLILALSGDGAKSGSGIERMKTEGMNAAIRDGLEIPFIVMSPQTPFTDYETVDNEVFKPGVFSSEAVDIAVSRYSIDTNRVYIFSLSMSGPSTPNALAYFPNKFAAGCSVGSWETSIEEAPKIKGGILDVKSYWDTTAGPPDYNIAFIGSCVNAKQAKYVVLDVAGHTGWYECSSNQWLTMNTSSKYPGSSKPMNLYDWYLQFSTSGNTNTPIITNIVVTPSGTTGTTTGNTTTTTANTGTTIVITTTATTGVTITTGVTYNKIIPGKIEAEAYDSQVGVATQATTDVEGGLNVGWIENNDYMIYNVNVLYDGDYSVDVQTSSPNTVGGQIKINDASGSFVLINLPNTFGWQKWVKTSSSTKLKLKAGVQNIRITAVTGGFNFNWFELKLTSLNITAGSSLIIGNPITINAVGNLTIGKNIIPLTSGFTITLI